MKLYIRSQNKEKLVEVKELSLQDNNILKKPFILNDLSKAYDLNYDLDCSISIIANDNYNLGNYKSKERALEILDEFQEAIEHNGFKEERYVMAHGCYETIYKKVYEMPKE